LSVYKNKLMYYNYINYYINQNNCYILIIPAFGIVSQIVSTFSGKPIFGQCGPKYYINILKHTICRKVRNFKKQNTILVSHLNKTLNLSNLIHIFLIISCISIGIDVIKGAGIISVCFSANGIVFIYLMMVKIFVSSYNPQITKARVNNLTLHKSNITLNSGLSMRVEISEAIRMLFFSSLKYLFTLVILKKKQTNKALILFYSTFNFLFKIQSVLNSTNTNTADSEKGEYKSNIEIIKLLGLALVPLRTTSLKLKSNTLKPEDKRFNQWLAGLIDGDGCFQLSKKGYASLEIVAHIRDKNCLYQIKQKFGGAVKLRSNLNHLRFRMHHKQGMLDIINAVNGEIRNPIRLLQLNKICEKYNIPVLPPAPLTYENAWLSGFFDSEGSTYLNLKSSQMYITAGQKNKYLLDILCELYGGSVYIEKISFKWIVYTKSEIIKLLDYFKLNPCRSAKLNRINAIPKYYELRDLKAHLAEESTILGKAWKKFLLRWDKWEKIK
jgi:hypothetical protein